MIERGSMGNTISYYVSKRTQKMIERLARGLRRSKSYVVSLAIEEYHKDYDNERASRLANDEGE